MKISRADGILQSKFFFDFSHGTAQGSLSKIRFQDPNQIENATSEVHHEKDDGNVRHTQIELSGVAIASVPIFGVLDVAINEFRKYWQKRGVKEIMQNVKNEPKDHR